MFYAQFAPFVPGTLSFHKCFFNKVETMDYKSVKNRTVFVVYRKTDLAQF
jgi:hypothetical protein